MQLTDTPPTVEQVRCAADDVAAADRLGVALYMALPAAVVAPLAVRVEPTYLAWRGVTVQRSDDDIRDAVDLATAGTAPDDLFVVPAAAPSSWMRQRWSGSRMYLFGPEIFGFAVEVDEPLESAEIDFVVASARAGIDPPFTVELVGRRIVVHARGLRWLVQHDRCSN